MWLLECAQQEVIRLYQQQVFSKEIDHLKDDNTGDWKSLRRRRSGIYNLDPYIDEKDLLRIGEDSSVHLNDIRPVLLGKVGNIPRLIVEWCHKKVVHEACHKWNQKLWFLGSPIQYYCQKSDTEMCQMPISERETWRAEHGRPTKWQNIRLSTIQ